MTNPPDKPLEAELERILYNLESEYMINMERVYKGKDTGMEMGLSNADSSRRALTAIKAAFTSLPSMEMEARPASGPQRNGTAQAVRRARNALRQQIINEVNNAK